MGKRLLHVVILTGPKRGDEVHLPRICCDSAEDTDLPFALRRYQFPVRLAWAMTINKSQGQTFGERIGIYLNKPVFAHGQLYCAMSRATRATHVRILAKEFEQDQKFVTDENGHRCLRTLNIVNRAFLHGARRAPAATSQVPGDQTPSTTTATTGKRRKRQQDDESWERDAGAVSIPEVEEDADLPPDMPENAT